MYNNIYHRVVSGIRIWVGLWNPSSFLFPLFLHNFSDEFPFFLSSSFLVSNGRIVSERKRLVSEANEAVVNFRPHIPQYADGMDLVL